MVLVLAIIKTLFNKVWGYVLVALGVLAAVLTFGKVRFQQGKKDLEADLREKDLKTAKKTLEEGEKSLEKTSDTVNSWHVDRVNQRLHELGRLRSEDDDGEGKV